MFANSLQESGPLHWFHQILCSAQGEPHLFLIHYRNHNDGDAGRLRRILELKECFEATSARHQYVQSDSGWMQLTGFLDSLCTRADHCYRVTLAFQVAS